MPYSYEYGRKNDSGTGFLIVILGLIILYASIFIGFITAELFAAGLFVLAVGVYLSITRQQARINKSSAEQQYTQAPTSVPSSQIPKTQEPSATQCAYCGAIMPSTDAFCSHCGAARKK